MISLEQVKDMIQSQLPDAEVWVKDLGGGDHLEAVVVSTAFVGQSRVKQHQMVYVALQAALASEAIHALALKTFTPDAWAEAGQPI
ncbi:BolA/IbaG family iron-sulfur metabolism protein [Synechocystis sp. LKSZ1]|uniref:BolA family protein n=1 Tax=Synechocystis sp. LKSZ1 TaxID=3144951 RepID=UPI00336BFB93